MTPKPAKSSLGKSLPSLPDRLPSRFAGNLK
jgi:hypothetical protein